MVELCCLVLAATLLPSLGIATFLKNRKSDLFFLVPIGLGFRIGMMGILAVIAAPFPYGWVKLISLVVCSSILEGFFLSWLNRRIHFPAKKIFSLRAIVILFLLSALLSLDNAFIYSKNGFSKVPGQTYFRPPMHDDMERHTIVTNALIRHTGSPLLANSEFLYQLTWHHLSAAFVSVLRYDFSRYKLVEGFSLAIGILFSFVLLWGLYWSRPALFLRPTTALLVLILLFTHADIFHFVWSSITGGTYGIEADWSQANPSILRYFSLKLILLTAPQHATFFLLLVLFITLQNRLRGFNKIDKMVLYSLLIVPLFIMSPLVTGFFFIPYALFRLGTQFRNSKIDFFEWAGYGVSVLVGFILHKLLFSFWPQDLLQRPGTSSLVFLNHALSDIFLIPALALGTAGLAGAIIPFLPGAKRRFWPFWVLYLGLFIYHYAVTDTEVRRHFAMVAAFATSFLIASVLPSYRRLSKTRGAMGLACASIVLSLGFHGYYLYCYLGKPSTIDPTIQWADYFDMNNILEQKFPNVPVIGAVDPKNTGNDYPVAMEVSPSFSMPNHAVIHTRVTPEKFRILRKIMTSGDIAPYALPLGYQLILWGPVEERAWGKKVQKRFLGERLAQAGSVSLFRLVDRVHEEWDKKADPNSSQFYYSVANQLLRDGWFQEALGYYFRSVEIDPKNPKANFELAQLLDKYERKDEAQHYFSRVKEALK